MPQTPFWLARVAGLALVGVLMFLSPPATRARTATEAVTYALVCVGVAAWVALDIRHGRAAIAGRTLAVVLAATAAAASVGAAVGGNGNSLIAFAIVPVLAAAGELPLATALAVGAVGVLAVEIGGVAFDQGVGTLVGFPLLLVVGLLLGRNRAAYRVQAEQSAELLAQHERLRVEQRRADVLDERARIAREIHDVLAHSLGALGIQIQAARALLTDVHDVDRAVEVLTTAQRMASDGLIETRRAVLALRTDTLPLHDELARAGREHAERYRVPTNVSTDGSPRPLPPDATVALLRTAQEALVNAAKHAPGQAVGMHLDYGDDRVRLTVANDLAGGAPVPGDVPTARTVDGGYGLTGMRERLRLLRGTLDAGPRESRWIVTADVPLERGPADQTPGAERAAR